MDKYFRQWATLRSKDTELEKYDAVAMDTVLSQFYGEIRKCDGSDYEPDSLRVMQASLQRYLADKGLLINILKDQHFLGSRKVLEGKA